ncbi:uncoupling protein 3 [Monoraphidium neglectum]|uniref:Uncoupling protein 3 n=1 Tax=Monoraphidium neglectum TaxID=145388 RepID=A0A0D2MGS5_9CHLO|nr:uncoupling protein 3 [Monoraphidium neglectum]KIZ02275.1 uncoupling protein 3 [Monoraphidium neglectum]|eukprot:XP_013901294.1 uncoupling protein 3 [Monoraphidium neglectum]
MSPPPTGPPLPFPNLFAASAVAACTAEIMTLPLDTAKVRLQLQGNGASKYKGLLGTCATIAREEGAGALWKGLEPGLHRQVVYGGLRIGLYEPVKNFFVGKDHVGDVPLHLKIAAGLTTGAIGITVASPTDLVKVRMQSEGKLAAGAPKKYPNAVRAYGIILREEGLLGLWKGLGPNIARNAIINAAELASYDQIKQSMLASGIFSDNIVTHLVAGLGAGFFAVCVGSPVDVVKSRVMGERLASLQEWSLGGRAWSCNACQTRL